MVVPIPSAAHSPLPTSEPVSASAKTAQFSLRVQVPNNQVLRYWVIAIIVQALGKYMIIRYLDP